MSVDVRRERAGDLIELLTAQASEIAALKAELAERRDQCRAVIEHNPYPTWVYSPESLRFLEVNDVALRLYGWTRDEFLAMTIADIRPLDDVPALLSNLARMRRCPGGITGPWRHRHKDGAVVEVMVSFLSFPYYGQSARLVIADSKAEPRVVHARGGLEGLSPREREVFLQVARGHTSLEIATKLGVSPKSVETYRARFMIKLGLETRADIVEYAVLHGLLAG
jgi:PAS domain S-box-containing protein